MPSLLTEPEVNPAFLPQWKAGLKRLQPSESDLAHGLELHRSLTICESYGFLPSGWSQKAIAEHHKGLDGQSYTDFMRRMNFLRTTAASETEEGRDLLIAALDQAGVHCVVQPVNDYGETMIDAVQRIAAFQKLFLDLPERLYQTGDVSGIDRARETGATAVIYSLTGMPTFGAGDMTDPPALLEWVRIWHAMGVRFMHVGYNRRNLFSDGCTERTDGGLSELGRDLVEAMNRTGIVVDVPHSSRQTLLDATKISSQPVIASHIGCKAIFEGPRCKSDEELKAIAGTGGYVGIYAVPHLLGNDANLTTMLQHVAHAIKVVGPEHLVIGTDIGYNQPCPEKLTPKAGGWRRTAAGGWNSLFPLGTPNEDYVTGSLAWTNRPLITVGLVQMGLSDDEIAQIHYGNFRRVLTSL